MNHTVNIYLPIYLPVYKSTWSRSAGVSSSSGFSPGPSRQSWQRVMRPWIRIYYLFLYFQTCIFKKNCF